MTKLKTTSELNDQAWYRLLKVSYVIVSIFVLLIVVFIVYISNKPYSSVDNSATTIKCNYGNKKTFTADEAGIFFVPEDFPPSHILPDSKRSQLQQVCEISKEEIQGGLDIFLNKKITNNLFDVSPSISAGGGWAQVIIYSFIAFLIIGIVLEVIKRIFYYIILGSLFPKQSTENE